MSLLISNKSNKKEKDISYLLLNSLVGSIIKIYIQEFVDIVKIKIAIINLL